MALYDVDKDSEDRGSPMPNHDDKLIGGAIKSHKTLSTHYTTDADTNPGRLQMQNKQILGNDGTTNITLYGYNQALNAWGFFVTKAGTEVTTNTDLSKFIFNSNQDTFKIVATGLIAIPDAAGFTSATGKFNSSSASTVVAHNLGYTPVIIGASSVSGGGLLPFTFYGPIGAAAGSISWDYFNINCDANNIVLNHTYAGFGGTTGVTFASSTGWGSVKYYLLQETAN